MPSQANGPRRRGIDIRKGERVGSERGGGRQCVRARVSAMCSVYGLIAAGGGAWAPGGGGGRPHLGTEPPTRLLARCGIPHALLRDHDITSAANAWLPPCAAGPLQLSGRERKRKKIDHVY